ncbi:MAG: aromatic amino acid lyase [Pseudomonadota bacterium]
MTGEIELGAGLLSAEDFATIAAGAAVGISTEGLARMQAGHDVLTRLVAADAPIYGVTTGLGPRVVDRLDRAAQLAFPRATVRGRAHAVGRPLPVAVIRAALAIRAHTLLSGATGARPGLAEHIAACLNAKLTPVVGETGSIGAADLMWGGMIGLGLIGEGEMDTPNGPQPASEALESAGLMPWEPAEREGLAFVSNSSVTGALAALGLAELRRQFRAAQAAAALSLEGFRGNLSPIEPDLLALAPKPGQAEAASGLRTWLEGSGLFSAGAARRLQDPLSLRNIVQIQGAVAATTTFLDAAVRDEINYPTDNPVVLIERGDVLSGGSYLSPQIAIALQAMNEALRHHAAQMTARIGKLINTRFSDLPAGLTPAGVGGAGFGAMMKSVEALFAEIAHLAQPAPIYPSPSADGVEDTITHAAIPAKALHEILRRLWSLTAMEMLAASQAIEMRGVTPAPALIKVMQMIRQCAPPLTEERSLSAEIEDLVERLTTESLTLGQD